MTTRTCFISGALLAIVCNGQFLVAQTKTRDYVWSDGFLERDYSAAPDVLERTIDGIFERCVAVGTPILDGKKGVIRLYGVGEKNGKYKLGLATWNGVNTISELDIKEGGVVIAVKSVAAEKVTTVGFKVGKGDKKASESLHSLLTARYVSATALRADKTGRTQVAPTIQTTFQLKTLDLVDIVGAADNDFAKWHLGIAQGTYTQTLDGNKAQGEIYDLGAVMVKSGKVYPVLLGSGEFFFRVDDPAAKENEGVRMFSNEPKEEDKRYTIMGFLHQRVWRSDDAKTSIHLIKGLANFVVDPAGFPRVQRVIGMADCDTVYLHPEKK